MASPLATPDITVKVLQGSPNLAVKADPAYNMYEVFTTVSVVITYVTVSAYSPLSYSGRTHGWKSYNVHQVLQAIDTII